MQFASSVRLITAASVIAGFLLTQHVIDFCNTKGDSMRPTINPGNFLVIDKWHKPRKGDVVIAQYNDNNIVCKRLVGCPDDILINAKGQKIKIPKNHYWLEGDNSKASYDSRHYGPIDANAILGRVIYIIWPYLLKIKNDVG